MVIDHFGILNVVSYTDDTNCIEIRTNTLTNEYL